MPELTPRPEHPDVPNGGIIVVAYAVLTCIGGLLFVTGCLAGWLLRAAVGG